MSRAAIPYYSLQTECIVIRSMETHVRATKKQQLLLEFVAGFIREHGYGPSYREIMNAIGYKSVSTVAIHINGLIAKGFLARKDNSPRSLEVLTMNTDKVESKDSPQQVAVQYIVKKLREINNKDDQQTLIRTVALLGDDAKAKELEETYET